MLFRLLVALICVLFAAGKTEASSGCVWKVTGPGGGTLYLGGSWHALRSTDYPLPEAYNRAFDASTHVVFEVDRKGNLSKALLKAGQYPRSDSLKNHVDPRTYDYLRRFFAIAKFPEEKFSRYRPWFLSMQIRLGGNTGFSRNLGVESFFEQRAQANSKPVTGLESLREHMEVFSGLSERGSEALLLVTLMPADKNHPDFDRMMSAWRRGDADFLANSVHINFRDFPAMADRLLGDRNRKWIPKLEQFMNSGRTYFVVVGAAHLGGSDGVIALLRARGCNIERL